MRSASCFGRGHLAANGFPTATSLSFLKDLQQRKLGNFACPETARHAQHGRGIRSSRRCLNSISLQSSVQEAETVQRKKAPRKLEPPYVVSREKSWIPPHAWQNAVVLIDKPQEWTSFDVCGKLRRVVNMKKVGHAGTLDPMATGLLVVCTGRGTKQVDTYLAQEKEYTGTLRLGQGTPSYDAESEINECLPWEHITDEELQAAKQQFLGDIMQIPPMFSAIKIGGERLYHAARRGEIIERPVRAVTVSALELSRDEARLQDVHFRVVCSKGTYIRSLVYDLGRVLGSVAHMTALRRTRIGSCSVADAWTIPDLEEAVRASNAAGYPPDVQAPVES